MVPASPRNCLTSFGSFKGGHNVIFSKFDLSGSCPWEMHCCPTIKTSGTHICALFEANVALAIFNQCIIWCMSWVCSQMKHLIPRFFLRVSGVPFDVRYCVSGFLMGRSSINMLATDEISSLITVTMHCWNSAGELVNPVGNEVICIINLRGSWK